ncbi:hypothetical protein EX30DRAFT_339435 [Ascodesmis nigricans]|uniref:Uncharacterized protein n=1 Tax=Ascodesmis nigricans TaxID=341454 RepID=A0A4V6RHH1_9PEZI|nr:hypothetical protein EX30DRAFT_339435 [Ascodesmis nigricans]
MSPPKPTSQNPELVLNAPHSSHPTASTGAPESTNTASTAPSTSAGGDTATASGSSITSNLTSGLKSIFGVGNAGGESNPPASSQPSETTAASTSTAHPHPRPDTADDETDSSNPYDHIPDSSRDIGKQLPRTSERGHRGGIVGMESDARGGDVKVKEGVSEDMESFFGIKKRDFGEGERGKK